jgi:hypothetical protein
MLSFVNLLRASSAYFADGRKSGNDVGSSGSVRKRGGLDDVNGRSEHVNLLEERRWARVARSYLRTSTVPDSFTVRLRIAEWGGESKTETVIGPIGPIGPILGGSASAGFVEVDENRPAPGARARVRALRGNGWSIVILGRSQLEPLHDEIVKAGCDRAGVVAPQFVADHWTFAV